MIYLILENSFKDLFLGGLSYSEWMFQVMLISMGVFLRVFKRVYNRKYKILKPSISYWVKDVRNWARLMYSLILMYLLIRFFGDYEKSLRSFIPGNFEASVYLIIVGIGFYLHKISYYIDSWFKKDSEEKAGLIGNRPKDR